MRSLGTVLSREGAEAQQNTPGKAAGAAIREITAPAANIAGIFVNAGRIYEDAGGIYEDGGAIGEGDQLVSDDNKMEDEKPVQS